MSYITLYLSIASVPFLITNIIRVSIKLLGVMPLEFYSNFLYVLLFIIIPLFWSFILLVKLIAYGMNLTSSRSFILIFTSVMFTAFILIPVFIIFSLLWGENLSRHEDFFLQKCFYFLTVFLYKKFTTLWVEKCMHLLRNFCGSF